MKIQRINIGPAHPDYREDMAHNEQFTQVIFEAEGSNGDPILIAQFFGPQAKLLANLFGSSVGVEISNE